MSVGCCGGGGGCWVVWWGGLGGCGVFVKGVVGECCLDPGLVLFWGQGGWLCELSFFFQQIMVQFFSDVEWFCEAGWAGV